MAFSPSNDRYQTVGYFPMKSTRDQKLLHEISTARDLVARFGLVLRRQPELGRLLARYRSAIDETQNQMHQKGVAAACTACAIVGPGSCCFEGIEAGYDHILLLINLLMGCTLPDSREAPGTCFFVGTEGCKLQARYYFCLHYLCPALQTSLRSEASIKLLSTVGKELAVGWEVEQALRGWLHKSSAA